ncbi:MAG: Cys-Gln thioester bond-forming surface protein [Chloroflexi bacterium]|nr:Cys-Gln thioester bond-forming surface protein [Chloroflexota bacterium]
MYRTSVWTRLAVVFAAVLLSLLITYPVAASAGDGTEKGDVQIGTPPLIGEGSISGGSIAIVTGTGDGVSVTHPQINGGNSVFAGTLVGTVDGNAASFYCIDVNHRLATNQNYTDDGPTPSKITYILNHYYPHVAYGTRGDELSTKGKEAAAVQVAIWHFSDGIDVTKTQPKEIRNRALAIVADANANAGTTTPVDTLEIQITGQDDTTVQFIVIARDHNGNGVAGVQINLSVTGGTLSASTATTGSNGATGTITVTRNSNGFQATITATANVIIPQGTRYIHVSAPNDKQKLVLATPTQGARVATSQVSWERDFGDAPTGYLPELGMTYHYPTLFSDDGARHFIVPGVYMGNSVDSESDGQPHGDAVGDDLNGANDEDGVTLPAALTPGQQNCIDVSVSVDGYLNAWFDFNGDGDWDDSGERVFFDQAVTAGTNNLCFPVPSGAASKRIYARFRFTQDNPNGALTYTGLWNNGEVEDYWVSGGIPTAVTLASLSASAQSPGAPGAMALVTIGLVLAGGVAGMRRRRQ